MRNFRFSVEDYILYILNKLEPQNSNKIKVNKIAFFTEFGYIYKKDTPLSKAEYAGINYGPVINDYKDILLDMEKKGLLFIDGNTLRPLAESIKVPSEVSDIVDPLIEKYSKLSSSELVSLSHETDSYRITTNNKAIMGNIIDKDLAHLETFFAQDLEEDIAESDLPPAKKEDLIPYETTS